ncbi:DUF523 domain-containing protein [Hoeflea sp. TYP-13]|uniref:DUF523 domain-containing protein n=1 Tax=Hoeflea sp. TYP-13 TaxID=3230023 RepID=UPI0034C60DDA
MPENSFRILISACLLGRPVRYNGSGKLLESALIEKWQAQDRLVPFCPEVAAGLPTPRPPAEIESGLDGTDVLNGNARILEDIGTDVTTSFIEGARLALDIAQRTGCRFALLTDGSPSCGSYFIHTGNFDGSTRSGIGVVTALLRSNGIAVYAESRIADLARHVDPSGAGLSP